MLLFQKLYEVPIVFMKAAYVTQKNHNHIDNYNQGVNKGL